MEALAGYSSSEDEDEGSACSPLSPPILESLPNISCPGVHDFSNVEVSVSRSQFVESERSLPQSKTNADVGINVLPPPVLCSVSKDSLIHWSVDYVTPFQASKSTENSDLGIGRIRCAIASTSNEASYAKTVASSLNFGNLSQLSNAAEVLCIGRFLDSTLTYDHECKKK